MTDAAAMATADINLEEWRARAKQLEAVVNEVVVGQFHAVRMATVAVFARGHVLLEGDVGVGKTTLLRCIARAVGGAYERVEGTVDLMPADLIYHTYIGSDGRPCVDPGPLLRHGEDLVTFFFNEVNRARPQVHSLLLRAMAERSVSGFNREYYFPYLQVFADRNRVEKEETFELPAAARDRFLMEIGIGMPADEEIQRALMFDVRFHDTDELVQSVQAEIIPYRQLNDVAGEIQRHIHVAPALQEYALNLVRTMRRPQDYGIELEEVDTENLVIGGGSPRGMSALIRAARVHAWLCERDMVVPEDLQALFFEVMAHRVFFNPVYEHRRETLSWALVQSVLQTVAAP